MLREEGFLGVCSAYGGWNNVGEDPFHIQRIHGDPSFERVKNWLTYDERIRRVERYDYTSELDAWKQKNSKSKTTTILLPLNCPIPNSTEQLS